MRISKIVKWQRRTLVAFNMQTHRIVLATFPKGKPENVVNRDATDEVYEAVVNDLLQDDPKRGVRVFTLDGKEWFSITVESVDPQLVKIVLDAKT